MSTSSRNEDAKGEDATVVTGSNSADAGPQAVTTETRALTTTAAAATATSSGTTVQPSSGSTGDTDTAAAAAATTSAAATASTSTTATAVTANHSSSSTNIPSNSSSSNSKVKVHFVAVGSAPIMKKNKFQISADQKFAAVITFLRKMLKMQQPTQQSKPSPQGNHYTPDNNNNNMLIGSGNPPLLLYIQSAFVPGPEEVVGDLRDCFSIRDELIIHYSIQEAWG